MFMREISISFLRFSRWSMASRGRDVTLRPHAGLSWCFPIAMERKEEGKAEVEEGCTLLHSLSFNITNFRRVTSALSPVAWGDKGPGPSSMHSSWYLQIHSTDWEKLKILVGAVGLPHKRVLGGGGDVREATGMETEPAVNYCLEQMVMQLCHDPKGRGKLVELSFQEWSRNSY